jgi:hypothetical protein
MTISTELFYAILAMDSYNRGYEGGLADNGTADLDGLGDAEASVGGWFRALRAGSPTATALFRQIDRPAPRLTIRARLFHAAYPGGWMNAANPRRGSPTHV